jgi:hypothetical protein
MQKGAYADVVVKLGLVKILTRRFDICEELYVSLSPLPLPYSLRMSADILYARLYPVKRPTQPSSVPYSPEITTLSNPSTYPEKSHAVRFPSSLPTIVLDADECILGYTAKFVVQARAFTQPPAEDGLACADIVIDFLRPGR